MDKYGYGQYGLPSDARYCQVHPGKSRWSAGDGATRRPDGNVANASVHIAQLVILSILHQISPRSTTFHDIPRHSTTFHDIPRAPQLQS